MNVLSHFPYLQSFLTHIKPIPHCHTNTKCNIIYCFTGNIFLERFLQEKEKIRRIKRKQNKRKTGFYFATLKLQKTLFYYIDHYALKQEVNTFHFSTCSKIDSFHHV